MILLKFFCFKHQHHFSQAWWTLWQALRGRGARCPYSVTFPYLTGPNTCIQVSTAQPINHCLLIQRKRKCSRSSAQTLSVFGPDLFWSFPFHSLDVLTWKDKYARGRKLRFLAATVVWRTNWLHSQVLVLTSKVCIHTLIYITRIPVAHHDICWCNFEGKWHFIFYRQCVSWEALWLMHVPSGTCVLLKESPINLSALPINASVSWYHQHSQSTP